MVHVRAWRVFKGMQATTCSFAALAYAGAAAHAWVRMPGAPRFKLLIIFVFPVIYFLVCLLASLVVGPLRRALKRYVWLSFASGFGQNVTSVVISLGLLSGAALFMYGEVGAAVRGGRYPSGAFSAFGAGAGVLFAQALLVLALEREPKVRAVIEG